MQSAASSHLLLRAGLVAFLCSISVPSADCFATHATPFAGQGLRTLSCPAAFPVTHRVSAARPRATSVSMGLELEASAETTVRAPMERVWGAWSDFEQMPNWMPWIHAVEVGALAPHLHTRTLCLWHRGTRKAPVAGPANALCWLRCRGTGSRNGPCATRRSGFHSGTRGRRRSCHP
jgi:hypothetical protein